MYCLKYSIYNEMPLVLTSKAGDPNIVATEKYIPGASVLGLLATRYLDNDEQTSTKNACADETFHACFLSGRLTFTPAYPVFDGEHEAFLPVPLSIRQEKHGKNLYDLLYAKDRRTTAVKGFCALNDGKLQCDDIVKTLNFHHARDRETGTTDGEKIFTYEAIEAGYRFEGYILGDCDDLQQLLTHCSLEWEAYLGKSKNVQYGKVCITFLQDKPQKYTPMSILPAQLGTDGTISLSLLSDTVVYNQHGFPSVDSQDFAAHLTRLSGHRVAIKKARIKQGQTERFVGIWRLRTPSEQCFQAGSSFLLAVEDYDPAKFAELELRGIGEHTHQGFGRCRFAWQSEKPLIRQDRPQTSLTKPDGQMPDLTQDILKTLIVQTLEKEAELLALQSQKNFRFLPSNSLLGRLENVISNIAGEQQWLDFLNDLCKTAKDQLDACHNSEKTLLQHLLTEKISIRTILEQSCLKLQQLLDEFSLAIEEEERLHFSLYQRYWVIFLAMMRKRANKEGGEQSL